MFAIYLDIIEMFFYLCGRNLSNMNATLNMDIRDDIMEYLKKEERTLRWLARKTDIPHSTLYSIFKQKNIRLSDERRAKINSVLGTSF
jgi:predicted transcriptional regulator